MLSKKFNQTNTMIGNDIRLRKLTISDLEMLHVNCSSDEEVAKYCFWNYSKNIDETKIVLQKWISKYETDYNFIWGIECLTDNQLIGTISVVEKDLKNGICEIGYSIGKKWWSHGYTTECLRYVLNYLFHFVGFKEIICKAQSKNIGSIKVMKKNGMIYINKEEGFIDKTTKEEDYIVVYSIKKENFTQFNVNYFNYESPTFIEFQKFYEEQCHNYNIKIKKINNSLIDLINDEQISDKKIIDYCKLLNDRKKILFQVIENTILLFKSIKKDKLTIYLNGSYARNSQRLFSDIDLNFMYDNKYIKKNLPVEDITAFILANIFDIKDRDRIHPMGYLTLINDFSLTNSKYYLTVFNTSDMVISTCRDTCYDIMYENLNMPRSKKNITDYIFNENSINYIKEYVYNHEIVYTNTSDYILDVIKKSDNNIIKSKSFNYYQHLIIKKLISDINCNKRGLCDNIIYINDFKNKFKTLPEKSIYSFFSLLRRIEMYQKKSVNIELIKINFDKLKILNLSSEKINKIKSDYYKYIFALNKIELVFYESHISLSSHSNQKIDIIKNNYRKKFNRNLSKDIIESLNQLYDDLLNLLILLKEEY